MQNYEHQSSCFLWRMYIPGRFPIICTKRDNLRNFLFNNLSTEPWGKSIYSKRKNLVSQGAIPTDISCKSNVSDPLKTPQNDLFAYHLTHAGSE